MKHYTRRLLLYDLVAFSALALGGVALVSSSAVPFFWGKSIQLWGTATFFLAVGLFLVLVRWRRQNWAQIVALRINEIAIVGLSSILLWESFGFISPNLLPVQILLKTPDWVKRRLPEKVFERSDFRTGRITEVLESSIYGLRYAPHLNVMHVRGNVSSPVITDSHGFPNVDETLYSDADVVVTGDSFTMGSGVGFDQSWPRQLSMRSGLKVLNLGQGGWDLYQYPLAMQEFGLHAARRFLVVALTNWNDLQPRYYEYEEYWLQHPNTVGMREFLARAASPMMVWKMVGGGQSNYLAWGLHVTRQIFNEVMPITSATAAYLNDRFFPVPTCKFKLNGVPLEFSFTPFLWDKSKSPTEGKYLKKAERDLSKIKKMAVQKNLRVYLVYLPSPEEIYIPLLGKATDMNACAGILHSEFQSGRYQLDRYRSEYGRAANNSGLSVWDSTPFLQQRALEGESLAWTDDFHPNVLGHRRIAEFVFGILGNS